MDSEEQLLPYLSRRHLSNHDKDEIRRRLGGSLEWNRLIELCIAEEVYPIASTNFSSMYFEQVPAGIRERLSALKKITAFRNQHAVEELTGILKALDTHQIPTIPLKGLTLAHALYKDISLRTMCDLDILVPPQSAELALETLADLGYGPVIPEYQAEIRQIHMECQLVKENLFGKSLLELHWALLWSSKIDRRPLEDMWAEARPAVVFGANAFRMSPEWEFLFLATHAARHRWEDLKWLADIHDMCAFCQIDWSRVMQKAKAFRWVTIVQATFIACNTLFSTPIPPEVPKRERPKWLMLFPYKRGKVVSALFPFRWLDGTLPKLRYVWFLLFVQTVRDWKYSHYLPPYARFLYTPFRWIRLVAKFGPRIIRPAKSS